MEATSAGMPMSSQISTNPTSARVMACRDVIGPPSSRTTRRPSASLPRVRPRVRVSRVAGSPTSTATTATRFIAWATASEACATSSPVPRTTRTSSTTETVMSMRMLAARTIVVATGSSTATPSPVTTSSLA